MLSPYSPDSVRSPITGTSLLGKPRDRAGGVSFILVAHAIKERDRHACETWFLGYTCDLAAACLCSLIRACFADSPTEGEGLCSDTYVWVIARCRPRN